MFFIEQDQVLRYRIKYVTYGCIIVDDIPQKEEPHRTRLTVGGFYFYTGDVSTTTADKTTAKLIINSTIYTPGAWYMCCNIKNFYLVTPLSRYEYIKITIYILTEDIIIEFKLMHISHNVYIYCKIRKVMYSLP